MSQLHSPWGASGLYRYAACPKAASYSVHEPENSSEAAEEGTRAHLLAETTLRNPGMSVEKCKAEFLPELQLEKSSIRAVRTFVRHVRQLLLTEPDGVLHIEVKFQIAVPEIPEADGKVFGTCDVLIYFPRSKTLYIIDYKNGEGVDVVAEDNDQLLTYALGGTFALGVPVDRIFIQIVQPRSIESQDKPVKEHEIDPVDLFEHRQRMVDAIRQTIEKPGLGVPGDHCHFCKGDGKCEERAQSVLSTIPDTGLDNIEKATSEYPLPEPSRLDDWQIAAIVLNGPRIRQFIKAAEGQAYQRLVTGQFKSDALKLVKGKGTRKWGKGMTDSDVMMELMEAGVPMDKTYTIEVPSPAQADELLAEYLQGEDLLAAKRDIAIRCVDKESSGLRVVSKDAAGVEVKPALVNSEGLDGLLPPPG